VSAFIGEGTKKLPLNSGPGIGIIGRRLLGSIAELELLPPGFRTSTYFLACLLPPCAFLENLEATGVVAIPVGIPGLDCGLPGRVGLPGTLGMSVGLNGGEPARPPTPLAAVPKQNNRR